jgi:hypothetical protein
MKSVFRRIESNISIGKIKEQRIAMIEICGISWRPDALSAIQEYQSEWANNSHKSDAFSLHGLG